MHSFTNPGDERHPYRATFMNQPLNFQEAHGRIVMSAASIKVTYRQQASDSEIK
jgi:hypothetical protein